MTSSCENVEVRRRRRSRTVQMLSDDYDVRVALFDQLAQRAVLARYSRLRRATADIPHSLTCARARN